MSLLEIQNLKVHLAREPQTTLVREVGFTVSEGQWLTLLGSSGSGKTVTALSIVQLLEAGLVIDPVSKIVFKGQDLLDLNAIQMRKVRREQIGMIFQDPGLALNPVRTIQSQLQEAYVGKMTPTQALEAVQMQHIPRVLAAYPHQLSGGMKQRIMIAMNLMRGVELLICDEATSALDAALVNDFLKLLKALQKQYALGILWISHQLHTVREVTDDFIVMAEGQLIERVIKDKLANHSLHPVTQNLVRASELTYLNPPATVAVQPLLTVSNMTVGYPRHTFWGKKEHFEVTVQDFRIQKGEIIALMGGSGCGKSTFARALAGLTAYTGQVTYSNGFTKGSIQWIPQDPFMAFNPRRTIYQSLEDALWDTPDRTLHQALIEVKTIAVGLKTTLLSRYPHELSGGQKQRFSIARALLRTPQLLICDEVTSSIDVLQQQQVLELLHMLHQTEQLSILLITHDAALAARFAHRVVDFKTLLAVKTQ